MGEKLNEVKGFLFENILNVAVDQAKEVGKEAIKEAALSVTGEMGVGALLELSGSMIPAIGPAISNYKTNKKIKNVSKFLEELDKKHDELETRFSDKTQENKEILDDIFAMVIDKASATWQEEKMKYMVNGYSDILRIENPSFDTAYLYFDTLDKLTILDIDVLILSYNSNSLNRLGTELTYEDILTKFDITYDQYSAVRENLNRLGLLSNEYDENLNKDVDAIQAAITELRNTTDNIVDALSGKKNVKIKKLSNKSKVKLKAKDRLKISKFGRTFVDFIIDQDGNS